ncbi:MAG: hypothetical protein AAF915_02975 [Cyanobacteria bacterium P01_D01_bin.50]
MLERVVLAVAITICIHLFLNLGGKSSQTPSINVRENTVPGFLTKATFFAW